MTTPQRLHALLAKAKQSMLALTVITAVAVSIAAATPAAKGMVTQWLAKWWPASEVLRGPAADVPLCLVI